MTEQVHILGEGGAVFTLDLPLHEAIQDRLNKGYLTLVADPSGTPLVQEERTRPAVNAPKAEWVGYAVSKGLTPDDAEAFTKTDLIEKFGANPA